MTAFTFIAGAASILGLGVSGWTLFKVYQIEQSYNLIIHAERAQQRLKAIEQSFLRFQDAEKVPSGKMDAELRRGISVLDNLAEKVPGSRAIPLKKASAAIESVLDDKNATEEDYWRVYGKLTQVIEIVEDLVHSRKLEA